MLKPLQSHHLATVELDDTGAITLSAALWSELHIGTRVIVEAAGSVWPGRIACDAAERPRVDLDADTEIDATVRRVRVRLPRAA